MAFGLNDRYIQKNIDSCPFLCGTSTIAKNFLPRCVVHNCIHFYSHVLHIIPGYCVKDKSIDEYEKMIEFYDNYETVKNEYGILEPTFK